MKADRIAIPPGFTASLLSITLDSPSLMSPSHFLKQSFSPPLQTVKQFLLLSTVFYLRPPSNITEASEKVVGGEEVKRNEYYGLLRDSSSLTTASCPLCAAHDSGVRP